VLSNSLQSEDKVLSNSLQSQDKVLSNSLQTQDKVLNNSLPADQLVLSSSKCAVDTVLSNSISKPEDLTAAEKSDAGMSQLLTDERSYDPRAHLGTANKSSEQEVAKHGAKHHLAREVQHDLGPKQSRDAQYKLKRAKLVSETNHEAGSRYPHDANNSSEPKAAEQPRRSNRLANKANKSSTELNAIQAKLHKKLQPELLKANKANRHVHFNPSIMKSSASLYPKAIKHAMINRGLKSSMKRIKVHPSLNLEGELPTNKPEEELLIAQVPTNTSHLMNHNPIQSLEEEDVRLSSVPGHFALPDEPETPSVNTIQLKPAQAVLPST
jgi:hypothetical protein